MAAATATMMGAPQGPLGVRTASLGLTALMASCQLNNELEVKALLQRRPTLTAARDRTGKTALHYCAENITLGCAQLLLATDPGLVMVQDEEGYTALHFAVISGNRTMVRFLVDRGADVSCVDNEKHSCVHWATVCGELECLDILVGAGADPSTPDIHGAYPIHYAAQMCGPNSEVGNDVRVGMAALRRLIDLGVDVGVRDQDGRPPLLWAASVETRASKTYCPSGSSDAILALVNAGADVSATDKDGLSALHCAASRGHVDCIETLVSLCGAQVDALDTNGCSALFYAVTLGHADCTQLLLKYGAMANRQDKKGRTAAHCGAAKGQLETLKILLQHGANLYVRNIRGDLPLHDAVQSGRKDLVQWLLDLQPSTVNAPNNNGRTALHVAAVTNNVEICKILMDRGADVNPVMRNSKGHLLTPLDASLQRGNRGCAKYLRLHGALPFGKMTDKHDVDRWLDQSFSGLAKSPYADRAHEIQPQHAQTHESWVQTDSGYFDEKHASYATVHDTTRPPVGHTGSAAPQSFATSTKHTIDGGRTLKQAIITNVYVRTSGTHLVKRRRQQEHDGTRKDVENSSEGAESDEDLTKKQPASTSKVMRKHIIETKGGKVEEEMIVQESGQQVKRIVRKAVGLEDQVRVSGEVLENPHTTPEGLTSTTLSERKSGEGGQSSGEEVTAGLRSSDVGGPGKSVEERASEHESSEGERHRIKGRAFTRSTQLEEHSEGRQHSIVASRSAASRREHATRRSKIPRRDSSSSGGSAPGVRERSSVGKARKKRPPNKTDEKERKAATGESRKAPQAGTDGTVEKDQPARTASDDRNEDGVVPPKGVRVSVKQSKETINVREESVRRLEHLESTTLSRVEIRDDSNVGVDLTSGPGTASGIDVGSTEPRPRGTGHDTHDGRDSIEKMRGRYGTEQSTGESTNEGGTTSADEQVQLVQKEGGPGVPGQDGDQYPGQKLKASTSSSSSLSLSPTSENSDTQGLQELTHSRHPQEAVKPTHGDVEPATSLTGVEGDDGSGQMGVEFSQDEGGPDGIQRADDTDACQPTEDKLPLNRDTDSRERRSASPSTGTTVPSLVKEIVSVTTNRTTEETEVLQESHVIKTVSECHVEETAEIPPRRSPRPALVDSACSPICRETEFADAACGSPKGSVQHPELETRIPPPTVEVGCDPVEADDTAEVACGTTPGATQSVGCSPDVDQKDDSCSPMSQVPSEPSPSKELVERDIASLGQVDASCSPPDFAAMKDSECSPFITVENQDRATSAAKDLVCDAATSPPERLQSTAHAPGLSLSPPEATELVDAACSPRDGTPFLRPPSRVPRDTASSPMQLLVERVDNVSSPAAVFAKDASSSPGNKVEKAEAAGSPEGPFTADQACSPAVRETAVADSICSPYGIQTFERARSVSRGVPGQRVTKDASSETEQQLFVKVPQTVDAACSPIENANDTLSLRSSSSSLDVEIVVRSSSMEEPEKSPLTDIAAIPTGSNGSPAESPDVQLARKESVSVLAKPPLLDSGTSPMAAITKVAETSTESCPVPSTNDTGTSPFTDTGTGEADNEASSETKASTRDAAVSPIPTVSSLPVGVDVVLRRKKKTLPKSWSWGGSSHVEKLPADLQLPEIAGSRAVKDGSPAPAFRDKKHKMHLQKLPAIKTATASPEGDRRSQSQQLIHRRASLLSKRRNSCSHLDTEHGRSPESSVRSSDHAAALKDSGFSDVDRVPSASSGEICGEHLSDSAAQVVDTRRRKLKPQRTDRECDSEGSTVGADLKVEFVRRANGNRPRAKVGGKRDRHAATTYSNAEDLTLEVQRHLRKYQLERQLFSELQELKRHQIRSGRSHEQVLVKRLVDRYRDAILKPGMKDFQGQYTFKNYEAFLYGQLRDLSTSNEGKVPSKQEMKEILLRAGTTENPLECVSKTYKCQHAAQAYRVAQGTRRRRPVRVLRT